MKIISNIIFEFCWYAAIIWSCTAVTGETTGEGAADDEGVEWLESQYSLGGVFQLSCAPGGGGDPAGYQYTWQKDNSSLEDSAVKGRFELVDSNSLLNVRNATEDDYGNYTCLITRDAQAAVGKRGWRVRAIPELSLPPEVHVPEGYPLILTCAVRGKPYPAVTWTYKSEGVDKNVSSRAERRDSSAGVPGGELRVGEARRSDAGAYACRAESAARAATADVLVDTPPGGLSGGAIAGIVVAVVLAVTFSVVTYGVYRKRKGEPLGLHHLASWRTLLRMPDSDTQPGRVTETYDDKEDRD